MTAAENIATALTLFADGLRKASEDRKPMQPPDMLELSRQLRNIAMHIAPPVDFAALERAARGIVVQFPVRAWHGEGERA